MSYAAQTYLNQLEPVARRVLEALDREGAGVSSHLAEAREELRAVMDVRWRCRCGWEEVRPRSLARPYRCRQCRGVEIEKVKR